MQADKIDDIDQVTITKRNTQLVAYHLVTVLLMILAAVGGGFNGGPCGVPLGLLLYPFWF